MAAAASPGTKRGHARLIAGTLRDAGDLIEPAPATGLDDAFATERRREMRTRLVVADVPLIEEPGRDVFSDLAFHIEAYLRKLTIAQLICLAYGHRWPELIPGGGVPKGFRAIRDPGRQGVYLVTEACVRETLRETCGTQRTSLTLPRGIFDRNHGRAYAYDDANWEVRPAGSRLSRLDFLDEILRRMGRELFPGEYGA